MDEDDTAFDGDRAWHVRRVLRDGREVTIRPISPEDRDELARAFRATSPRTRYLRFLGIASELDGAMLTYLTNVDQQNHVALVATIESPDLKTERGVGVARFIRLAEQPDAAEAAITVVDDAQKKGLGTLLALEIARAARQRGIRSLRAEVLEDNEAMRGILEGAGAKRVDDAASFGTGTVSYDVALEPASFAERMLKVLRGAAETMALTIRRLAPPTTSERDAERGDRDREPGSAARR